MGKFSGWSLIYDRFEPTQESLREALCTLGNGYFGTRGAALESAISKVHYPGTYLSGVYNKIPTRIAGRTIYNEDMVNCPNWMHLTFRIGEGEWFLPASSEILSFKQELNMRKGMLIRKMRFQDFKGRRTQVTSRIIVHMGQPHIGAIEYTITPLNYSGFISVVTMLDATVQNLGVERYRQLNSNHLRINSLESFSNNGVFLVAETTQSKVEIIEAERVRVYYKIGRKKAFLKPVGWRVMRGRKRIGQEFKFFVSSRRSYVIEKIATIYTSKDSDVKSPFSAAINTVNKAPSFKKLLGSHLRAWRKLWNKVDIQITGDNFSQLVLRLHMFHLLQTASSHTASLDVAIPARGLHGEAYRGHVFWDEIYTHSFYDFHLPEVAKGFLLYRYRRLGRARQYAEQEGFKGAMFPWQSGSSGVEETQIVHLNPLSGKWGPDYSRTQRHINFAIAYNVWQYWVRVGDVTFLRQFGAELFLSIARFCASLAKYNARDGRFHTRGIMGPDEFHEKLPNTPKVGLRDNAYSNVMIVWILLKAKEILQILSPESRDKITKKLKLTDRELRHWDDITKKINIIINRRGIISQFDGYFNLKELDWTAYRAKYRNIRRMDRILKAEGKSPDSYKISKQADVTMMFYLLSLEEIKEIFTRLGYRFTNRLLRNNYQYYLKRTSHGSTLSKVVHCFVSHQLGRLRESSRWYRGILESDIYDTQGGTTSEGIHVGVMGGSIDIVVRQFLGVNIKEGKLIFSPRLPSHWRLLSLRLCYRGTWLWIKLTQKSLTLSSRRSSSEKYLPFEVNGKPYTLRAGKKLKISVAKSKN